MKKTFMGLKLRRLRAERGLSQTALAHTLGISPSYLNQIEQNQRPLPLNKSSTVKPVKSCPSQLNSFSRTLSGVGRNPSAETKVSLRPLHCPPIIRT